MRQRSNVGAPSVTLGQHYTSMVHCAAFDGYLTTDYDHSVKYWKYSRNKTIVTTT